MYNSSPFHPIFSKIILFFTCAILLEATQVEAITFYVNDNAAGLNNGSSWGDAYNDLQDALAVAGSGDEIWVAEGVYVPGSTEADTFQLKNGVAIYGGFQGVLGEEGDFGVRDFRNFLAVLSGDIDQNDSIDPNGIVLLSSDITGDNSDHVVTGSGTDATAILDGFVVTAGQADGGGGSGDAGGGIANSGGSPTLSNLVLSGNSALMVGGGLHNTLSSSPTLINVAFTGNSAAQGGGIYNFTSSPTLANVLFSGNTGTDGAGMYNFSSSPVLTNVTFSKNSAFTGGGMFNQSNSDPFLQNCILWGNTPQQMVSDADSDPILIGSVVESGCPDAQTTCAGIIDADPMFADADGSDDVVGTLDDDLRLSLASPGVDAGANNADLDAGGPGSATISDVTRDLAGNLRIVDGDGDATATVDMGAYESSLPILYVNDDATGTNNGSSWVDAFVNLQDALILASPGAQIWVAEGIYVPGPEKSDTFQLPLGVEVYGGFEGTTGTEGDFGARDFMTFATILSGDIDGDDANLDGNHIAETVADIVGINNIHVVTGSGVDSTSLLDGFTITAGQTETGSGACLNLCGGGMFNDFGEPTLSNLVFSGNRGNSAGGMLISDGSPRITDVIFIGNEAMFDAGALRISSGTPTLVNVQFLGNISGGFGGGALYTEFCSSSLTNVAFSGNTAMNGTGGGMLIGLMSDSTLTNVTFSSNTATNSGAAFATSADSSATILNSVFWENSVGGDTGPNSQIGAAAPTVSVADSLVQGGCPDNVSCDGVLLIEDPLFIDSDGADNTVGTLDDDLRLVLASPARNAGNNSHVPPEVTTDLAGDPRIVDGAVDMGAYEIQQLAPTATPTSTPSTTPASTNTAVPTSTPTSTPSVTPSHMHSLTPTLTPTHTPIEPTPTPNYDIQPQPVTDGAIDARDLIEWIRRIKDGSEPGDLLFDFSRFWERTNQ